jgi:hypothetical protein
MYDIGLRNRVLFLTDSTTSVARTREMKLAKGSLGSSLEVSISFSSVLPKHALVLTAFVAMPACFYYVIASLHISQHHANFEVFKTCWPNPQVD